MAANTRSPHDVSGLRKIIDRFKTRRKTESGGGNAGGVVRAARAEYLHKGRVAALDRAVEYKSYRIHTTPHLTGLWISMIVSIGTPKPVTKDSLTDTVTRVPGEYTSEEEAIHAARAYIDREVKDLRIRHTQTHIAPASA